MNKHVKSQIINLHCQGVRYVDISRQLKIPVSTIKSFVYSHQADVEAGMANIPTCPNCGAPVPKMHFKPRRFCSDRCRVLYWKEHQDELKHTTMVPITCTNCHGTFMDYAGRNRRYCSHSCYIQARYGGGSIDKAAIQQ